MNATEIRSAVEANPGWYHTIELAPGVVTPGHIDLRRVAARVLPGDLAGARALDVGTYDGFWAFEMERRGADVVAIDVERLEAAEWPPVNRARLEADAEAWNLELGRGFALAAEALASGVRRVTVDAYHLTPDAIGGPVELAFVGAILLHLRDPVRALERVREALAPGGRVIVLEPISVRATLRAPRTPLAEFRPLRSDFDWWMPNLSALKAYLHAAQFTGVRRLGFHRPPVRGRGRAVLCALEGHAPPA